MSRPRSSSPRRRLHADAEPSVPSEPADEGISARRLVGALACVAAALGLFAYLAVIWDTGWVDIALRRRGTRTLSRLTAPRDYFAYLGMYGALAGGLLLTGIALLAPAMACLRRRQGLIYVLGTLAAVCFLVWYVLIFFVPA